MFTGPEVTMCILTGDVSGPCTDFFRSMFGLSEAQQTQYFANADEGILPTIFRSRELSGVSYVQDKLSNWNIVPVAHAQTGFGFGALSFVQELWGGARNITYSLMILIIIAMSFMIMFRTKISPQAVITVQSALPTIVVSLILITFSYAIAGFLIDLMYVSIGLVSLLLSSSGIFICPSGISLCPAGSNLPAAAIFNFMTEGEFGLGIFGSLMTYWMRFNVALVGILLTPGGNIFTDFFSVIGSGIIAPFIGIISFVVVTIFMLLISFRVFAMLIKTFVNIVLSVITAPFIIAFSAISKSGGGFSGWIRGLAAHLAVYPVTGLVLWVSYIFLAAAYHTGGTPVFLGGGVDLSTAVFFVNPDLFNSTTPWAPPLTLGTENTQALRLLWLFVSVGVLAILPKTVELIQSVLNGKPFGYGSAIGESLAPGVYGPMQSWSGRQQASWNAAQKTGTPKVGDYVGNFVGNFVRTASGGKIK